MRLRVLALLAVLAAAPAAAQTCVPAPPARHGLSLDYAAGQWGDSTGRGFLTEAGVGYVQRIAAPQVVGTGNVVLVEASYHTGRLDNRDTVTAIDEAPSVRGAVGATAAATLFDLLVVCAHAGGAVTAYASASAPTRWLEVPFGIGFGAALKAGGLTVAPFVFPLIVYHSAFYDAGRRPSSSDVADQGVSLVANAGLVMRFGHVELRGMARLLDERLSGSPQVQMRAMVWF
jgi:hypothetical protein